MLLLLLFKNVYSEEILRSGLKSVKINNTHQWIYITTTNINNPLLLVLHGGPGFAMLPLFHDTIPGLESNFTVVNWDQRGAGKSYNSTISLKSLTLNQLVSDSHELTLFLKSKFKQKKIFVLGHSTGTMVGIRLIKKYPNDYQAFIGVGQVVNVAENEQASYDFALNASQIANNKIAIKQLLKIGRPDHEGNYSDDEGYDITTKWVEYFGGSLYQKKNLDDIYKLIFSSQIYRNDRKKILKGYDFCQSLFDDKQMHLFNLEDEIKSIQIPIYFLSGFHDRDTPFDLIKNRFNLLQSKMSNLSFVTFQNSAHFPFYEEPEQFISIMKTILEGQ